MKLRPKCPPEFGVKVHGETVEHLGDTYPVDRAVGSVGFTMAAPEYSRWQISLPYAPGGTLNWMPLKKHQPGLIARCILRLAGFKLKKVG